jgi:hypothetical protein
MNNPSYYDESISIIDKLIKEKKELYELIMKMRRHLLFKDPKGIEITNEMLEVMTKYNYHESKGND